MDSPDALAVAPGENERMDNHVPIVIPDGKDEVTHLIELGRDREAAALAARRMIRPLQPNQGAPMDPRDQLDEVLPLLNGLVASLGPSQLDAATPCTDFVVADILDHMIGGGTAFAAAFRGEVPPTDVGAEDRVAAFPNAMANLQSAVRSPGALDRTIAAPFGEVPGEAFARFVALDGLIHAWDIATATGQAFTPSVELVSAVDGFAHEAITADLRGSGAFGAPIEAPSGASPLEHLVAFTGRPVASR